MFENNSVVNQGIGSDTTEGLVHRVDSIIRRNPKMIFLNIGINDLIY